MKILKAKYILVCDEKFEIYEDKSIVFDDEIIGIYDFNEALKLFNGAKVLDYGGDIIMPAFINPHVHLEFSANSTTLIYGDFLKWVNSVVKSRNNLSKEATDELINSQILRILRGGVGTIGEISSFGDEARVCANSQARFVFFNEILGTNDIDKRWENFIERFERSCEFKSDKFITAVSIHAPYSTHSSLTKKACEFARENGLLISTHLLESKHEKEWLMSASGEFKSWLANFTPNPKPYYDIASFVENFAGLRTLFTHALWADDFGIFDKNLHFITHCAFSNRLLSGKNRLNLDKIKETRMLYNIATDGLSSNISLNFFDELRANLLVHYDENLEDFSKELILASTLNSAKALNLNLGSLQKGKIADISVIEGFEVGELSQISTQIILQTKEVKSLFIKGKECKL